MNQSKDELSIKDILLMIFRGKWFLIGLVFFVLTGTYFYTNHQPKKYESYSSFFLPPDQASPGGSALGGYSRLLGISQPANINNYISTLLGSRLLNERVRAGLKAKYGNTDLVRHFSFNKAVSVEDEKNGFYFLVAESTDPEFAKDVLVIAFNELKYLIEKFEVSSKKDSISILDSPEIPEGPSGPILKKNMVMAGIASFFVGIFLTFCFEYFKDMFSNKSDCS